jgi:hypothetical protein
MYVPHSDQNEMSSYLRSIVYISGNYSSLICPLDGVRLDLSELACLEVVTVYTAAYLDEGTSRRSSLPPITRLVGTAGPSLKRLVLNISFPLEALSTPCGT